jgi:hypothetical protein
MVGEEGEALEAAGDRLQTLVPHQESQHGCQLCFQEITAVGWLGQQSPPCWVFHRVRIVISCDIG